MADATNIAARAGSRGKTLALNGLVLTTVFNELPEAYANLQSDIHAFPVCS